MTSIRDSARAYQPKTTRNVSELEIVDVNLELIKEQGLDKEGNPYEFFFFIKDNERFRVPNSVLEQLQGFLNERPTMTKFKVKKSGSGLNTKYQVIPID